jgi:uncharacterized protein DUF6057
MTVAFQRKTSPAIMRFCLFFTAFYLYVLLRIDTSLFYHAQGMIPFPVFYRGAVFFKGFPAYPGGLIEYASAFCYQFFYYPYLGSLIITSVALLICLVTGKFVAAMGDTRFRAVIFIPAVLILIVYSRYRICLNTCLALLAALLFLWLFLATARRRTSLRLTVFLFSSIILYYIAGGGFLLYAVLCGIFELNSERIPRGLPRSKRANINNKKTLTIEDSPQNPAGSLQLLVKRNYAVGLSFFLAAVVFPFVAGRYIFQIDLNEAYLRILPFHPESYAAQSWAARLLYVFFPVAALWLPLQQPLTAALRQRFAKGGVSESGKKTGGEVPGPSLTNTRSFLYESGLLFLLAGVIIVSQFDRDIQTALRINSFARQQMWDQVLVEARRLPGEKFSLLISHDVDNALYHTGRLAYDLFSYPQSYPQALKALSTLNYGFGGHTSFAMAELPRIRETFFRLGLVNLSELTSYVGLELNENPANLKNLFYINAAKGYTGAARINLCALSKDPITGGWAESQLHSFDKDPVMSADKTVQYVRSVMPSNDFVEQFTLEDLLLDLLKKNKQNQMAFEYLMAHYLLSFKFDKIAQHIHRLNDFDYPGIPALYEEALLIRMNESREQVDLHGRKIREETEQRFRRFIHLVNLHKQNDQQALGTLEKEFGNSYFFYCIFGHSGKTR